MKLKTQTDKQPEASLHFRVLIWAAMMVPLLALVRVRVSLLPAVLIAALGITLGHIYSYKFRAKPKRAVRGIIFVAIHLSICWLFVGLFSGAAVPQAQFAIFLQAITSFDLRYRSSLYTTLGLSLAILYVAASLSRTSELAVYLLAFAGLILVAFYIIGKTDGMTKAKLRPAKKAPSAPSNRRGWLLFGLGFALSVFAAIFIVFLFTPRFANRPIVPPFTLNVPLRGGIKAEIVNPGVPVVQINGWSNESSDYFYGFDTDLDLRYRGGLSDDVVMYVRSPSRSYWRSHSYDVYTGIGWTQSDKSLTDITGESTVWHRLDVPLGSPLEMTAETFNPAQQEQIVQTFTIARTQPNLLFAAYRPREIYLVSEKLSLDGGDGIRLPQTLEAGLTYSVVSYRPNFDPALLQQAGNDYPPEITARYLQLPDTVSARTKALAQQLTAGDNNTFDKVMALNDHLLAEYPYNFFPPPHPEGADAVDTFLFEDREGVCEQYVSALVVMARSLGIPARLVTGYGSGDYNAMTGYYEVRANQAHSWAEVYFPQHGWVPFDPTPGWIPQPYPTPVQTWFLSNSAGYMFDVAVLPLVAVITGGAGILSLLGTVVAGLVGLVVLAAIGWVLWLAWKRYWGIKRGESYSLTADSAIRRAILKLYWQGYKLLLRRKYRPRYQSETLAEYADSFEGLVSLARLTHATEKAIYAPQTPSAEDVGQAQTALAGLKEDVNKL